MANVSRRNFLAGSAVAAGLLGLAGCAGGAPGADALAAPDAASYPIAADAEGTEAKWSSEKLRKDGWTRVTNPDGGAELGVMDEARLVQVGGYAFRDMNGNGKLDLWEDWRQTDEARAEALASALSAEEILPLMFNNGFMSTSAPLDDDAKATIEEGMRAGVSRAQAGPSNYVEAISWINAVQAACESAPQGIPYLNDTDQYQNFDIPDNNGLAASMDMDLIRRAATLQGRTWRATGVRCLLGPQIDVASNPNYCRYSGTVSVDPALNRDFAKAFISGIQSTYDADGNDQGWGADSIIGMAKHYVGAGAVEGGRNDHSDGGKYNVFPGDNFKAHLVPFLDGALDLGTKTGAVASIMPNYGIAYDENLKYGENVGGGFSALRNGYLRNLGWDGMITTDWQITDASEPGSMMPNRVWGVEDLTPAERQLKGIKASDDQFGGEFLVGTITEAYKALEAEVGADEALARVRDSARRIFTCMNHVDLFDNPYTDREDAKALFEDEASAALGVEAGEKSLVMIKNAGNVINKGGLGEKPRVYIPQVLVGGGMFSSVPASFQLAIPEDIANEYFDVVTDTVGEPTGKAGGGFPGMPGAAADTEDAEPVYQASDAVMPSDEELASCQYALLFVTSPAGESGSSTGPDGTTVWTPSSLQYRPYTADGDNVRRESIAGNQVDSETGAVWDSTTGGVKENRSHYGQTTVASNESDLDAVIAVREKLGPDAKLILVVEATRPMCFHEIEPYADVILLQFQMSQGVNATSLANIVTGKTEPSALLPCQMPKSMDEVEANDEDVPRAMACHTDSEGNTYDFAFGLNWSGVINDERTKKYGAAPLAEPAAELIEE